MMRRWRWIIGAVLLLCAALCLPLLAQGQGPGTQGERPNRATTQPADEPDEPFRPGMRGGGRFSRGPREMGSREMGPRELVPNDSQWEQVERFMSRHTPRRLEAARTRSDYAPDLQMRWRTFTYNR
jgi:hypothetical protein